MSLKIANIGGYRIVEVLGEGGMGRVFRAHDPGLQRDVALKLLKPELAKRDSASQRFLREARAVAKLSHPRVVTVFQVGEHENVPFLVMELLDGEDLHSRLQRAGPLPVDEALVYMRDAAEGLQAALEEGLVHRDVKPGNLIVVDGHAKLTDFGLARPLDGSSGITRTGVVVGTPAYVAPEVARGKDASEKSDIYALGCTFFEILTGRQPFEGETIAEVLSQQIHDPPPDILVLRPDVPRRIASLIERMLAKEPSARPENYGALLSALSDPEGDRSVSEGSLPSVATDPARVSGKFSQAKTVDLVVMHVHLEGFSERTSSSDALEVERWLELHDALLLPVYSAYRGKVAKSWGDALLATFDDEKDAVYAAAAIQDRLALYNEQAQALDRIRGKVALASGPVRRHREDLRGEAVHMAARLEEFAEPGEVLMTEPIAKVEALPSSSRGKHELRGVGEIEIFALVRGEGALPFEGKTLPANLDRRQAPPSVLPRAALAGLALILVVGIALTWALTRERDLLAEIDAGRAEEVLLLVNARTPRTGEDERIRGKALLALEQRDNALEAFGAMARLGVHDEEALAFVVDRLERGYKIAPKILEVWPDPGADVHLRELVSSRKWRTRHRAEDVLRRRGVSYSSEPIGILDLEQGAKCESRRQGLARLQKIGKSQAALDAISTAARRQPDNFCMLLEFGAAESAIRERMN